MQSVAVKCDYGGRIRIDTEKNTHWNPPESEKGRHKELAHGVAGEIQFLSSLCRTLGQSLPKYMPGLLCASRPHGGHEMLSKTGLRG